MVLPNRDMRPVRVPDTEDVFDASPAGPSSVRHGPPEPRSKSDGKPDSLGILSYLLRYGDVFDTATCRCQEGPVVPNLRRYLDP